MENGYGIDGTIDLNGSDEPGTAAAEDLSGRIHLLPCSVKHDGASSVSHYFKPKPTGVEVEGLRVEEAHFRGRRLQGTTISLPQGFSGFVLGKKVSGKRKALETTEEKTNRWEMAAKFKNITYWKHESLPSQHDTLLRSFHWLDVAKAMHQPVDTKDLVSASIALEKIK